MGKLKVIDGGKAESTADPNHAIVFRFTGWTGWDILRNLLPEAWQARAAARKLLAGMYKGFDTTNGKLIVQMIRQSYRVVDDKGRVEPCPHESTGGF